MRKWIAVGAVGILVIAGSVVWVSYQLSHQTRIIRITRVVRIGGVPTQVLLFHSMPAPAHRTTIAVRYVQSSRQAAATITAATAPFHECPNTGQDASCGQLIQVTGRGAVITSDLSQGPYDGAMSTLVGVVNATERPVGNLRVSADAAVFDFSGLGLCNPRYRPAGTRCPYGPTGYEGPHVSFTGIAAGGRSGTVVFTPPLAPGRSAYFSLSQALAATAIAGGAPTVAEQGGAPNPSEAQAGCSQLGPVNCATGQFWERFSDLAVSGLGIPLDMTRTYASGSATSDSPFGYGWNFSYGMALTQDSSGNVAIRQENGSVIMFNRSPSGGYTTQPWVMAALASSRAGFTLTRFPGHEQYGFTPSGRLAWEADSNGDITRLFYSGGLLSRVISPSGRSLRFVYNGPHVIKMIDPIGRAERFRYDNAGDLVATVSPDGDEWEFGYDQGHLLTSITDPRHMVTEISYDSSGRVLTVQYPGLAATTWSYTGNGATPQGGTTTATSTGHGAITYDYSGFRLTSATEGTGTTESATTSYTYNPGGQVTSVTGPNLQVSTYTYNGHGDMLTATDPLRRTARYTYNALDEVLTTTTPTLDGRSTLKWPHLLFCSGPTWGGAGGVVPR